jgi:hypothetical protein
VAKTKLEEHGFRMVAEATQYGGEIHPALRRMIRRTAGGRMTREVNRKA